MFAPLSRRRSDVIFPMTELDVVLSCILNEKTSARGVCPTLNSPSTEQTY